MTNFRRFAVACAVSLLTACSGSTPNTLNGAGGAGGLGSGTPGAGGSTGGSADGVGDPCTADGTTRSCCSTGRQTCGGTVEFKMWGPCLDTSGKTVTCTTHGGPAACGTEEFPQSCDASVPVDAGWPRVCGAGEFGPNCVGDGGVPPMPKLCDDESINTEPEILAGYAPGMGQTVAQNGQVKVWIKDEWPAIISMNEQIDPVTGMITMPGDRAAKAADGYLWEPALYIAPLTAESGGTPHFPQLVKGWYNNGMPGAGGRYRTVPTTAVQVPGIEPSPTGAQAAGRDMYMSEFIWDVSALGLSPGTYTAEFVIHDGDHDRAIGCVTITVTP
jgi:hypothetical protein